MNKSILLITGLLFSLIIFGQETKKINQDLLSKYPLPKVDKRVELLSIVFRLAGNFEYNDDVYRSYVVENSVKTKEVE